MPDINLTEQFIRTPRKLNTYQSQFISDTGPFHHRAVMRSVCILIINKLDDLQIIQSETRTLSIICLGDSAILRKPEISPDRQA